MRTNPTTVLLPALGSLGLSREELAALAENGSLHEEDRGQGKMYFRVYFRIGPKQHTRYIGNDQGFVDRVRGELLLLQAKKHSRRKMRRLAKEGRRVAREMKRSLEPLLPSVGRVFFGRTIRQRRPRGHDRVVSFE